MQNAPIVVYSHLRWSSLMQRPQHLFSRISSSRRVLFLEETVQADPHVRDSIELRYPLPDLIVARPILAGAADAFDAARLGPIARRLLRWQDFATHVAWLYTPAALELAQAMSPELVVYDCMDEQSALESELLERAHLVFSAGPSLYRAKRSLHPRVRCFPNSVDASHFQPREPLPEPPDESALARPRLGFFGVLDERLDRALLDAVAEARPDWQIVLVGPVARIDPRSLPVRPNLHYLGPRSYESLPSYLAGWDVCLLPFARSRATRCISPTQTLEYMAAAKPIVTTPIRDVVEPYGRWVEVAQDADAFVAACERLLAEEPHARAERVRGMLACVAHTSWDDTAREMLHELRDAEALSRVSASHALRQDEGLTHAASSGS
ncbi:MAG TPA: glycosyltransferase [Myxococcota bacterium]|nr:glycosyltransferase [Myxococcota bacterium]